MKKISILFLLLFFSFLNAENINYINKNRDSAVDKSKNDKLKEAIYYYKNHHYKKAYETLNKYLFKNFKNIRWQYYFGRSAYKLGKLEEALSAFERVLILDPSNIRAKLEMARIYFEMKKYDKSKKLFEEVLKEDIPKPVRVNVKKYIKAIEKSKKKSFLKAVAAFGISYDSNIYDSPVENQFYIPTLQINVNNKVTNDSDYAHQEMLMVNHLYDIGKSGDFFIKNNFLIFFKTMKEYSDKNIAFYSYSPALSYKKDRYLVDLAIGYERMFYGSNPYLHTFYLFPSFQYLLSKTTLYKISLKLQKKFYEGNLKKVRDSNFYELFLSIQKILNDKIFINPAFAYQRERKINSNLTNIDLDALTFSLITSYKISKDKTIGLKLQYKDILYKDIDNLFGTKRKDRYYNYAINFNKIFKKGFLIQAVLGHIKNSSNQSPYAYKKNYANINIIREF